MSNPRNNIVFVEPFEVLHGYAPPPRSCLSRDHLRTLFSLLLRGEGGSTEDKQIGLIMNYSIIFTEISFSPETSILLQIILLQI